MAQFFKQFLAYEGVLFGTCFAMEYLLAADLFLLGWVFWYYSKYFFSSMYPGVLSWRLHFCRQGTACEAVVEVPDQSESPSEQAKMG